MALKLLGSLESSGGNVGIGTASPVSTLHIKTSVDNSVAQGLVIERSANSDRGYINYNGGGFQFRSTVGDPIVFGETDAEHMRILPDGNVGIGTTSPSHTLDVNGELRVGTVVPQTSADFSVRRNGANIEFGHGNRTSGYYGTIGVQGNNGMPYIALSADCESSVNTFTTRGFKGNVITTDGAGSLMFSQLTTANATGQSLTERMRIDASGNVGIGTTSPDYPLEVESPEIYIAHFKTTANVNQVVGLEAPSGKNTNLYFYEGSTAKAGIRWDGANDKFLFKVGNTATDALTIANSGNVGIGTTSPSQKLDVEGGALGSTSGDSTTAAIIRAGRQNLIFKDTRTADGTDWNNATFKVIAAIDTTSHQSIDFVNDSGYLEHIDLRVGNQAFSTRFASNGNVGMGTTAPIAKLDVQSTGLAANPTIQIVNTSSGTFNHSINALAPNLTTGENNIFIIGRAASAKNSGYIGYKYSSAGSNLNVLTFGHWASDNLMNLTGDGKLGIGTTNPNSQLHVYGSGTTYATIQAGGGDYAYLRLQTPSSGDGYLIKNTGTGNSVLDKSLYLWNSNGPIQFVTDQTVGNAVTIDTSGNVGISVSNPSRKLQVDSAAGYPLSLNSTQQYLMEFARNGVSEWWFAVNNGDFKFHENGVGDQVIIKAGGNVGIGTTDPSAQLHVSDSGSATSVFIGNTGSGVSRAYLDASNGDFSGSDYMWIGQNNDLSGEIVMTQNAGSFHIKTQPSGTLTSQLSVSQNGTITLGSYGAGILKTNASGVISVDTTAYAPLASPALTGTPTAPTAGATTNTTQLATTAFVQTAVSSLVDSAPATLDTLNELAAALGDDASFSTTVSTALGNRLRIDVNNQSLSSTELANARTNLGLGTAATAASTAFVAVSGDTMTGNLIMSSATPTLKFSINGAENNAGIVWEDGDAGDPSAQAAAIKWDASSNHMRFYNNDEAAERMRINSDGTTTFLGTINASAGIGGLTLANGGISGTNYNITGVNQLEIADPGEGIVFKQGSSGDMTLAIVDDASDNILKFSGTNAKFEVAGSLKHSGLELTTGGAIDQISEFPMTFQLAANTWTDTGIDGTDLSTGTYTMQVYVSDFSVGGQHYNEYYSATISWYSGSTNSTVVDEIPVHRAGHAPNAGDLQFRTQRASGTDSHDLMLQVKTNSAYTGALDNSSSGKIMRFKFRRLM